LLVPAAAGWAFLQGLAVLDWSVGRNVRVDARWAITDAGEIRRHAAELVALASY
jgi:hypothetical protein